MSFTTSFGRPFVLIALLVIGTGLVWHIGQNLYQPAEKAFMPSESAVPEPELKRPPSAEPVKPQVPVLQPQAAISSDGPRIVKTERGQFIATAPILFNSGASTLREASIPRLNKIGEFLSRHSRMSIEIVGHTDNLGPEPVNQRVSAERAEIVMNHLIAQGIPPSRLRSRGMGSLDPIESNDTQLGRQANRRIEFLITGDARDR